MDVDDLKSRMPVPWDEVREQRVLARVLVERRRAPARGPRALAIAAAVVAVAATILLVVAWKRVRLDPDAPTLAAHAPSAPSVGPSGASTALPAASSTKGEPIMALADGSRAILVEDAGLLVEEQHPERVRIAQQRGKVVYDVARRPQREFTVRAAGTIVRVRGTIFTVAVTADAVEVSVERGRVEVDDGGRTRELSAGESLRVKARPEGAGAETDDAGSHDEDRHVVPAAPEPSRTVVATASDHLAGADAARAAGRLDDAAKELELLAASYPHDPRLPSALFSLGRVEHARHREAAAARAFERCIKAAPTGPLAEDALAEAATAWAAAGERERARTRANDYLAHYPRGVQAARMQALLAP